MLQDGQSSKQIGAVNRYQYNGKELNDDYGLDWSDYGARWYDASLGRWNAVDPLADHPNQVDKSPYAYAWNNPVNLTDPDGRCPHCPAAIIAGGVIGAGLEIYNQWGNESFDVGKIFTSAGKGAVTAGLIAVGAGAVTAAGGLTTAGGVATSAGIGATASGGVEAAAQLLTTGTIDGETVAVTALAGGIAAPIGGAVGKKISESVASSASARATETLKSATTGRTLTSAQKVATKALGPGATNAQKSAARSEVRSQINTNAKATFNSAQQSIGRNTAIIQGAGAAATTKTASEGSKSIMSRFQSWWNE